MIIAFLFLRPTLLDQDSCFEVHLRAELAFGFTSEYIGLAVQKHPLFEECICATLGVGRTRFANQSCTHHYKIKFVIYYYYLMAAFNWEVYIVE
jgi:hypothetical protein